MKKSFLAIGILLLAGCGENELYPVPAVPIGGGGNYSAPSRPAPRSTPLAPSYHSSTQDPGNVEGQRETHAVSSRADCDTMLRNFQKQGRQLRLVERRYVGGNLPYLCIFEGADAQPEYFDDNRYR
ncbi:MAG: hypothetical protein J0L70_11145 [Leptolyngbya sp. UWPOB_LEPTO1]|uniref:hypothetical protein n=1 Tax=Leptolyngbya sp. UWPOB_LEPTO1 TaxID=2815653 RepID=UPI001ACD1CBF|nr:hypothetical protein [Leptolyngbya sp. UWPOB_LEPTO1]MBN8561072.1 hypothetical protein [Leptolyngbya sp. UWPOB_LEPTO1]